MICNAEEESNARTISVREMRLYLWAAPNSAVGLLVMMLASIAGRPHLQVVDGVLEVSGGLVTFLLKHATLLPYGALAMTLGHVVLGIDEAALCETRSHERIHVRQCERWGPLFIPAYIATSLVLFCQGKDAYRGNFFEREAFEKE